MISVLLVNKGLNFLFILQYAPRPAATLPTAPCTRYTAISHPEDESSIRPSVKALLDRSAAYILPVYARPPFVLSRGKGAYVWDTQDRKYLDFSAGIAVNALGHADEGLAKVCHRIHCM